MFVSCNSSTTGVTSGAALLTHPDHLNSPLVFSWFVQLNLQFSVQCCVDHCLSVCSFCVGYCIVCPSSLVIALSVLLRFTASDYPFGIFKRFLNRKKKQFKETNTKSWLPIITNFKIQTSQASGLTVVSCLNLSLSQNSLVVRPLWIQNMLYGLPDTKKTMVCLNFNWIFK